MTMKIIKHVLEDGNGHNRLAVKLEIDPSSVDFYGTLARKPGFGPPVYLELYEGRLRLIVWADINCGDPTHMIDLEGARESERKEP